MTAGDIIVMVYKSDDLTNAKNMAHKVTGGDSSDVTNGFVVAAPEAGAEYDILVYRGEQVVYYDLGVQF
jgi:hypothetical protein